MKRNIRLKELASNTERVYIPSSSYLENRPKLDTSEIYQVKTDSEGNQVSTYANKSNKKIYFIGGSTVESIYAKQSHRPHSILEKKLVGNGYDYEVLNLAVSGTHLINVINLIVSKLAKNPGQTILIGLPTNDSICLQIENEYWNNHKNYATILPADGKRIEYIQPVNTTSYLRALKLIKNICDIYDFNLAIISAIYSGVNAQVELTNSIARKFCVENRVKFIDIEKDLNARGEFFYDDLHLSSDGCVYYAEEISKSLQECLHHGSSKTIEVIEVSKNKRLNTSDDFESNDIALEFHESVSVLIDFKKNNDIKKPFLLSVDYSPKPKADVLKKMVLSNREDIGFYKYITDGVLGKRIELSYDVEVPRGCSSFKLKLLPWSGGEVYIFSFRVVIVRDKQGLRRK